ncbi:MAG: LPS export ABC transporter permease LptG [Desulfopila sp.]
MRTLDLYIARSFLRYFLLIAAVLLVLFSLLELISQLDDVGTGNYHLADALRYVLCTLPKRLFDLMPVSTLLGGLIALGVLADHGELTAMEASGISTWRICGAALSTGLLLMVVAGILAELVVPGTEQMARTGRAQALAETGITITREGFWARTGQGYIQVGRMTGRGEAVDISLFTFTGDGRLKSYVHADHGTLTENGNWLLSGLTDKEIAAHDIVTTHPPAMTLESFLTVAQASALEVPPYSLSAQDLFLYIDALEHSGQNADQYRIALWRKLTVPLTTMAMVLLSLSFVFGSTRMVSAGYRITAGTLCGILLYFSDQILIQWGMFFSLPPVVTAMLPVVLIMAIAVFRLRHLR